MWKIASSPKKMHTPTHTLTRKKKSSASSGLKLRFLLYNNGKPVVGILGTCYVICITLIIVCLVFAHFFFKLKQLISF